MENAPVIFIVARSFKPEDEERHNSYFEKWFFEAYVPLLGNVTGIKGVDRYRIVKENPKYPKYFQIHYFDNLKAYQDYERNPELMGVREASEANFPGSDYRWFVQYQLTKSWRKQMGNAPVIHIVARSVKPEEEERHNDYYENWIYKTHLPLLAEVTGIRGADRYRIVKESPKYPKYIQIYSFDNLKSFEEYVNNKELIATREAIDARFPGSAFSWYVQYQLTKSWRK